MSNHNSNNNVQKTSDNLSSVEKFIPVIKLFLLGVFICLSLNIIANGIIDYNKVTSNQAVEENSATK